jgi:hypothetical protein
MAIVTISEALLPADCSLRKVFQRLGYHLVSREGDPWGWDLVW